MEYVKARNIQPILVRVHLSGSHHGRQQVISLHRYIGIVKYSAPHVSSKTMYISTGWSLSRFSTRPTEVAAVVRAPMSLRLRAADSSVHEVTIMPNHCR